MKKEWFVTDGKAAQESGVSKPFAHKSVWQINGELEEIDFSTTGRRCICDGSFAVRTKRVKEGLLIILFEDVSWLDDTLYVADDWEKEGVLYCGYTDKGVAKKMHVIYSLEGYRDQDAPAGSALA